MAAGLAERIKKGKDAISRAQSLGKDTVEWELHLSKLEKAINYSQRLEKLTLKELAKRDIAFQVYSEVLKCEVWFCSNDIMAKQVMRDDSEAITYTADELTRLLKHNTSREELNSINNVKKVLKQSKIIESVRGVEDGSDSGL